MGKCEFVGCMCRDNIYVCNDGKIYCSKHWGIQRDHLLSLKNESVSHDESMFYITELNKHCSAKQYASVDAYEAEKLEKTKQTADFHWPTVDEIRNNKEKWEPKGGTMTFTARIFKN